MHKQGSMWRRWDLHVHTPDTILNNQFNSWDEYLNKIEAHPDIKVLGVTDYLTISNYSKLKEYKEHEGRIPNIELLIPNIEFRIAPLSDKATWVNIHLLISPEDPKHETEINDALSRLVLQYSDKNYACVPERLIALGKATDSKIIDERPALEKGVMQFKIGFETLQKWFNNESWIRKNTLVAVAAGNDGLSGFHTDGAWGAWRDEITRFSNIIFSGNPNDRKFWLGQRKEADWEAICNVGGPKPCVHGSDAHSIAKLFHPDEDRYCWIKADPTFEGLRQILYEPEDRVHIGPTPPQNYDEARIIRSVKITDPSGRFNDFELPLNPGLVSIIGQKGAGKSALAELIAYAADNRPSVEDKESFLNRAGHHLSDMNIKITWNDGTISDRTLWKSQEKGKKVRYLSQKFVEHLCAEDRLGKDLEREIESVIFSHLDLSDTMGSYAQKLVTAILRRRLEVA